MATNKKYDYLVFIGRFQPFHLGHLRVMETAAHLAENIIVLVGSSNRPRTIKNPWTYDERNAMIRHALPHDTLTRTYTAPLRDQVYNDQRWVESVQNHIRTIVADTNGGMKPKIGIIGHSKDESSYYLKMFPQFETVEHPMDDHINATDVRDVLFSGKNPRYLTGIVPETTYRFIEEFMQTPEYEKLVNEYEVIRKYKEAWAAAPYAPTFVTVDAMVIQSGHVLLVERKAAPGEGLMALPGGFLNPKERLVAGAIRELREETKLKVPAPVLQGSIVRSETFDAPDRSDRGRTITHVQLIELPPGPLPQVKGSDDARKAFWLPLNEVREEDMFEDHYHVIQRMLGTV